MTKAELLAAAKRAKELQDQLASYERTRQAINRKAPTASKPGTHSWAVEQSPLVRANEKEREIRAKNQVELDRFEKKKKAGKAWDTDEDEGAYGLFDKSGYSAYLRPDQLDEITVSPQDFKNHAPQVSEVLKSMSGTRPTAAEIGNALVSYRDRFGDAVLDPMKLKHMIKRDLDPGSAIREEVEALPEKKPR